MPADKDGFVKAARDLLQVPTHRSTAVSFRFVSCRVVSCRAVPCRAVALHCVSVSDLLLMVEVAVAAAAADDGVHEGELPARAGRHDPAKAQGAPQKPLRLLLFSLCVCFLPFFVYAY